MKQKLSQTHHYLNNHHIWHYPYSITCILCGILLILAGVIMLVLPGPGILVILLGVAVLSSQFSWAKKILLNIQEFFVKLKHKFFSKGK